MTPFAEVRAVSAPPLAQSTRGFVRLLCTSNPFYVLSAALFLIGLRISFGEQAREIDTWALMSGLAGYTLLLAGTAFLLVRFCNVWNDVRTILLLVVLMFLATSVTFDGQFVQHPERGLICCLGGLAIAIVVTEGLLHGIQLALPAGFRLPYYLILGLFFLYPLALVPWVHDPWGEEVMWGLFGFPTVSGLIFLTLLPAIRRGPEYVRANGSPWRWPLYPWVVFGLLGLAVPARAFLLCWSMHYIDPPDNNSLIFGPYFLVPFGLALTVLVLEIGHVARNRGALATAMVIPVGLIVLAMVGHRPDRLYQHFLETFTSRLGADPLYWTLVSVAGFYGYAALRGVPVATEVLTGALVLLGFVGPNSLDPGEWTLPQAEPILAAAGLQLTLGVLRRTSWRCLVGGLGLAAVAYVAPFEGTDFTPIREAIAFHLGLTAVLIVGAMYEDGLARLLRVVGAAVVLLACLDALFGEIDVPADLPPWALRAYPLALAGILLGYGLVLRHRLCIGVASTVLATWLASTSWLGYRALRELVAGLDYIGVSLALFAVAVLASLAKAGMLSRWLEAWGKRRVDPAG
jgi:hypothetical protein